jgi:protein involved in polysaccharide export with SLBB domain
MLCVTDANAQINPGTLLSATSVAATNTNYYYARSNDLTIIVNVVGFVQRPGRYEIATSIDLINLISLAGGPTPDGALSKVSIIRMTGKGETTTHREIHFDLEDISTVKEEDLQLLPGDLILVDRTGWAAFRDVFPVVVSATTMTIAITQFILISR